MPGRRSSGPRDRNSSRRVGAGGVSAGDAQDAPNDDEAHGFSTRDVCEIVGVAPSTLNSWAKPDDRGERLVAPSLLDSDGKRSDRYWSVQDLVIVRTIKALRQAGCPMAQLRRAKGLIADAWDGSLADTVLYWDGADVVAVDAWGDLYSAVRHPGQRLFHLLAVPLAEWQTEAEALAEPIDLDAIRYRRAHRAGKDRRPETAAGVRRSSAHR